MIVVDTSALVAIYAGEAEAASFSAIIANDTQPLISAGTLIELSIVLARLTPGATAFSADWVEQFLIEARVAVEPVTAGQARIGREAFHSFGKGIGHPARLNFGDCFSYALAKALDAPLLYKGTDFAQTDIKSAV